MFGHIEKGASSGVVHTNGFESQAETGIYPSLIRYLGQALKWIEPYGQLAQSSKYCFYYTVAFRKILLVGWF